MLSFAIPFPRFSGQRFWVARFGKRTLTDGVYVFPEPEVMQFPGRIQPISDLKNIKSQFGESVVAAIEMSTPQEYEFQIETKTTENDYIIYRNQAWKVETAIVYDSLIPHNEAVATLVTNPGEDLEPLLPVFLGLEDGVNVLEGLVLSGYAD